VSEGQLANLIPASLSDSYEFWTTPADSYFGGTAGSSAAWRAASFLSTASSVATQGLNDRTVPEAILTGYPMVEELRDSHQDADTVILIRIFRRLYSPAHPSGLRVTRQDVRQGSDHAADVLSGASRVDMEAVVSRLSLSNFLEFKRLGSIVAAVAEKRIEAAAPGGAVSVVLPEEATAEADARELIARLQCETLMNPLRVQSPTMKRIVDAVVRIEPLAGSLFWSSGTGLALLGDLMEMSRIECVRLGTAFEPKVVDANAAVTDRLARGLPVDWASATPSYVKQVRLMSTDVSGAFISDRRDSSMAKILASLPNGLVLENDLHQLFVMHPGCAFAVVKIAEAPLATDRRCMWNTSPMEAAGADKGFYVYRLHAGNAFVHFGSPDAAFFLAGSAIGA